MRNGNKTDNGVHEVGTEETRLAYQNDTPGQQVEEYLSQIALQNEEKQESARKHFSQVFDNPLKGFPHNEEFEVKEIKEKVEYAEYKFKNKRDAQKALDYFKSQQLIQLDINDDGLSQGELAIDAGNKDMTKQHKEVLKKFKPKVLTTEIKEELVLEASSGEMIKKLFNTDSETEAMGIAKLLSMTDVKVALGMQKQNPNGFKKTTFSMGADNNNKNMASQKELEKMFKKAGVKSLPEEEVKEENLEEDYKKVIKMYPRDNDWKKLITKHKKAIDDFRNNNKDLPKKVEDELVGWASQTGEVGHKDDVEDFIMSILDESIETNTTLSLLEKAYDENDVKKVQQLEKKLQGMLKEVEKTMKGSGLSAPAFNNVRSGIQKGLESITKFYKVANTTSEETISENYRVLAKHGMGAETKNSIKVGTEVDYYQKDGAKYMGKITKMTPKGYIVRDDKTKKDHEFTYHDRNAAKKLLKQGDNLGEGSMDGQKLTGQEISTYFRKNPIRDKDLKKAIEIALDHGGAMSYAIKQIEKLKKGLSKKTEVKKALQFANEEVKYKLNVGFVFTEDTHPCKGLSEDDPCWKDYKQVGMKKKNGKEVPNCVPKEGVMDDEPLKGKYPFQKKFSVESTFREMFETDLQEEMITYRVKGMQKPEEDKFKQSAKMMGLKITMDKGKKDTVIVMSGTKKKLRDFDAVARGKSSFGDPSTITHFDEK